MIKRRFVVAFASVLAVSAFATWRVARGDDRATTAAILDELEHDPAHKDAVAEITKRARAAIERATRLRSAGDEGHARLADGLAREEAETARDLARAIDAEKAADDARRAAMDAGTTAERERALLEEGIAGNGRLRAQIAELGKPQAEARTSSAAQKDAGAPSAPAPKETSAPKGGASAGARDGGAK